MEKLNAEELADQIMRWDWRDMFREGNKQAIKEMFEAYGEQVKALNPPNVIKSVCERQDSFIGHTGKCSECGTHFTEHK